MGHSLCLLSVVWPCTVSNCSHSQSVIPSNAGPFMGTTKMLYQYLVPLLIVVIWHMLINGMHDLLYLSSFSSLRVCLFWLLHIFLKWFIFPHCEHLLPYAGNLLCLWEFHSMCSLLEFLFCLLLFYLGCCFCAHAFLHHWTLYLVLLPLWVYFVVSALPPFFAQANTCSLVIALVFLTAVNCLIISVIILLSSMLLLDCSFSPLCFSLYLHSIALIILQWPIQSFALSIALSWVYITGVIELPHCVEV